MGGAAAVRVDDPVRIPADTDLIQRCLRGDQTAFEDLIKRHQRRVFGLIYQVVRSSNDVEDIAQEVFTRVYFSLPQFRMEASFDAWLYRIAVNLCYDYLRRQKRCPQVNLSELSEEEAAVFESLGSTTQPRTAGIEKQLELQQIAGHLLDRLHPKDRLLLVLKEVEELTIEELMKVFKASQSAVKLRLFRARKQLQSAFEKSRHRGKRT
jgi:RNA polymerase sigma-70 factor (ECF subfamily)